MVSEIIEGNRKISHGGVIIIIQKCRVFFRFLPTHDSKKCHNPLLKGSLTYSWFIHRVVFYEISLWNTPQICTCVIYKSFLYGTWLPASVIHLIRVKIFRESGPYRPLKILWKSHVVTLFAENHYLWKYKFVFSSIFSCSRYCILGN